ncbi:serine/threonine protein kinase [Micromonospora sp. Llam7]|uniref:serine/threonine-protein kinase n=1 Tax=Micromonospora tarapacensis TaxID=2835305 RepID=UPI001C82C010|nr:serine/threonine-protein kinase [Micromonospora tarapacensis]MBX7268140.1 serine/threonine protein kinase [Micromonospora tarapacensis]
MADGMARVVVGRYRLTGPLGRGGMGAVWRAHDTLLGRDVAIKEIWLPSTGEGPVDPADTFVRRALREAQAAARLRHPGIVTVYDVVTDQSRPWIVMELINGRSLAETIQAHGLLTEQRTAEIGLQVLDALRAAHREGIAHRDVKPANILLDTDRVVLTDFGIAAIEDATALTATGQLVGSPAYLSPERINGQPVTAAADLWALGVTLYTAVTGRSPFQREDTQATLAAILHSQPATPAHAGRLWPVIKGLLIKDPVSRLGTEPARQLLTNVARPAGRPHRPRHGAGPDGGQPRPRTTVPPTTVACRTRSRRRRPRRPRPLHSRNPKQVEGQRRPFRNRGRPARRLRLRLRLRLRPTAPARVLLSRRPVSRRPVPRSPPSPML